MSSEKMDQKQKRGENWSSEEKDILRQLIAQSAHIIENKCTKTNTNVLKIKEWHNILTKLNEITGKNRSVTEIKLAWKRMKMSAKLNIAAHRQALLQTGGGQKPPSPSPEDSAVMAITPHDFVIEINDYDSDAALAHPKTTKYEDAIAGPSCEYSTNCTMEPVISEPNINKEAKEGQEKGANKGITNRKETARELIIESNLNFKKRHLELLEIESNYNIEIAKLKIKKLKLEIDLLETQKNKQNE